MLRIEITADTPQEFANNLAAIAVLVAKNLEPATPVTLAGADTGQPGPKPAGRKKAAAEEPAAGNSTGGATSQEAGSSAADEGKGSANSLDKDALAARCTAYGQAAGREALKQLFILLGAKDGKWTQVPADKYPALDQSLTDFGF